MPRYISQSAYARHRGVGQSAVARAIGDGRLTTKSIVMTRSGQRKLAKIRSLELADAEWLANTDTRRVTAPQEAFGVVAENEAKVHRRKMNALVLEREEIRRDIDKTRLAAARLEAEERCGALVPVQEARDEIQRVFLHVRTNLAALASQAKQLIPKLTTVDIEKLDLLLRESLEELADEEW